MSVRVTAIIAAAGGSRRMGVAKQLIELEGCPMLMRVAEALLASRAACVRIVTRSEIASRIEPRPRLLIEINDDASSEMIDSVRMGLRGAGTADGYLVCPGDLPRMSATDVDACIGAFEADATRIVIATHRGIRGHPILFPAVDVAFVASAHCNGGLSALPRAMPERVRYVECASDGVLRDVDTPADLERARREERE